ncbi:MAG: FAD-dependent oxidoreductase [Papillibacter sp.]|nr:FAD-dependent oxidoreductase [Papillibacter sp.]
MLSMEILKPVKIGRLSLKNRIEVSPAAPFIPWRSEDDKLRPLKLYYENLAASGAAVVTLGISSLELGEREPNMVRPACSPMRPDEVPELVEAIHKKGALASIEYSVMKYMMSGRELVSTMPKSEIKAIIKAFAAQAKTALEMGFDMIMLHGGHGNVPAQFFAEYINKRTDEYGGSFLNRSRFAVEMLEAVREAVGDRLAIEYRISAEEILPGTTGLEETLEFAKLIQDKIDLIHVSRGLLEEDATLPYMFPPTYIPRGLNLEYARKFKQTLNIPVSVVGGFDLDKAEEAVSSGAADVVAMIRTVLADTDCVSKLIRGERDKIRPCVRCNTCIDMTHSKRQTIRCAVNPLVGREADFVDLSLKHGVKQVAVIGGGPAGMQAALTASQRGHKVTLFEKKGSLGGALRLASAAVFKQDMRKYLNWLISTVSTDKNIDIKLNTQADADIIRGLKADAVILAVGAQPIIPKIESCPAKAVWVGDVETDYSLAGSSVVIAGAGFTGLEMALSLVREGRQVTVIDLLSEDKIGADGVAISMIWLKQALKDAGVKFICQVRLTDVTEEGAVVLRSDGSTETIPCDTVILSLGVRADRSLEEALGSVAREIYVIGDCSGQGGTLYKAISAAFDAAVKI